MAYERKPHHLDQIQDADPEDIFGSAAHLGLEEWVVQALIANPAIAGDIGDVLKAEHFLDHFLSRAFAFVMRAGAQGRQVTAGSLDSALALHPWYRDKGGADYLKRLCRDAIMSREAMTTEPVVYAARSIVDAYLRREVILTARDVTGLARQQNELSGEELMARLEARILQARTATGDAELQDISAVMDELAAPRKERTGLLKTGFEKIDKVTGGHENGELVLIGGRPGMGKSALGGCMTYNIAAAGSGVISLNGEMNTQQVARRMIADWCHARFDRAGPTYAQMRRGELEPAHEGMIAEARAALRDLPIRMIKRTGMTVGMIRSLLKRQKAAWHAAGIPLRAVFVDHVGLIRPDGRTRSRYEAQTEVSMAMKEIGDEVEVVMFGLAQLGRDIERREDKRPGLADFKDSGSWEQDADVVMSVYRDAYYAWQEKKPAKEIDIAEWEIRRASRDLETRLLKVREGQANQTCVLWADMARNAIRDEEPPVNFDF